VARGSRLCYARLLAHSSAGAADGGAGPSGNAPSRMRRSMDACSSVWEQRRFVSTTSAWTRVQELARCSARAEVSTPSACKAAAARTAQSRPSAASRSALLQSARRTARSKRRRSASSLGGGMAARPAIASMVALHETPCSLLGGGGGGGGGACLGTPRTPVHCRCARRRARRCLQASVEHVQTGTSVGWDSLPGGSSTRAAADQWMLASAGDGTSHSFTGASGG